MNRFRRYDLYPSTKTLNQLTVAKDVLNKDAVGGVYVFFDPSGRIPTEEAKFGFLSGRLLFVDRSPGRKIAENAKRSVSPAHGFRNTRHDEDEETKRPVVEKNQESLPVEEAAELKEEIEGIRGPVAGTTSTLGELGRYGRDTTRRTSSCGKHGGHKEKDCEKRQAPEETNKSRSRRLLESHLREGDRQSGHQLQAVRSEEDISTQRKKSNDIRNSNGAAPAIQPVTAEATQSVKAWVREKVLVIYQQHNPSKLTDVDKLLAKYAGKEDEMYQKICKKYGVAPLARGEGSLESEEKGSIKLPPIVPESNELASAPGPPPHQPGSQTGAHPPTKIANSLMNSTNQAAMDGARLVTKRSPSMPSIAGAVDRRPCRPSPSMPSIAAVDRRLSPSMPSVAVYRHLCRRS